MEVNTITWAVVGIVIAGGGALVVYNFDLESVKNEVRIHKAELSASQATLQTSRSLISQAKAKLDKINQQCADQQNAIEQMASLEAALPKQEAEIEAAKQKWQLVADKMTDSINEARSSVKQVVIAEIPRPTGDSFKNCKIVSIDEDVVSFSHAEGTARLTAQQIPPSLQARIRVDWKPMLTLPPDPSALVVSTGEPSAPLPALDPIPEPGTTSDNAALDAATAAAASKSAKAIQDRQAIIQNLTAKMVAAKQQSDQYWRNYYDHDAKYSYARAMGRSSSQSALAEKAKEAAMALDDQIAAASNQIRQLKAEIRNIR